jgi:pentatricopeptide repeat protein
MTTPSLRTVTLKTVANYRHAAERTLRAYESGDDAYRVFRKMLESGHPPGNWDQLLAECQQIVQPDFAQNRSAAV